MAETASVDAMFVTVTGYSGARRLLPARRAQGGSTTVGFQVAVTDAEDIAAVVSAVDSYASDVPRGEAHFL